MITKTVLLECAPERAFALFTEQISAWWPADRRHTSDAHSVITLSPAGRFFERDRSGKEVELGLVLAWEPPERLLLDFYPGTDANHPTRVEVRFSPSGAGTRVVVVHTATAKSETLFPVRAPRYETSWELVLRALAAAASLDNT